MADHPDTPAENHPQQGGGSSQKRARRKRRTTHRFRWNVRLILGVPIALALVLLLLMRSPLVGHFVGSQIYDLSGCTLEGTGTTGAYIGLDGRLVLKHFRLQLPGVPGEAGTVLAADQAVVDLDWSGVLTGDVTATAVRLSRPVFRVSQSIEDGEVNLSAIAGRPRSSGSKRGGASAPKIDAMDGTIIFAEHARGTGESRTLKELRLSGSFMPIDMSRPVYSVRFAESGQNREKSMLLDGRVNLDTGATDLKLFNLSLGEWKPESIPSEYRELWRRLNVQGRIPSASMSYDEASGTSVEVTLDNVSMNALVPAEDGPGSGAAGGERGGSAMKDLALEGVSGTVGFSRKGLRAELVGKLEGQTGASTVRLRTMGTDANSALTCEIEVRGIAVTREAILLPYMPARAKQYFRMFSGPTGEIDARVIVSRGAPVNGEPAPIQLSGGRVMLRHGEAAFQRFPYAFLDTAGEFQFDDNALRIVRLEGRGKSGATLVADGIITPLNDEAMVDVNVHAEHVPIDEHLLGAMPADRRRVLEGVFSRPEYDRLLRDGLIRAPGTAADGPHAPPEFALAGECSIAVNVHTPQGKDAPWFTTVDVSFAKAGMLADPFPLPVLASDVKLRITDDDARLLSGTFAPLPGGTMDLAAAVAFYANGKREIRPDVRIAAKNVPIGPMLLHALPQDDAPGTSELGLSELMRRLNPSGVASCDARVTAGPVQDPSDPEPIVAYDIGVDLSGARCAPAFPGEPPAFTIDGFRGGVRVTRESLTIEHLRARLRPLPTADEAGLDPAARAGGTTDVALSLSKQLGAGEAASGAMTATLTMTEVDLAAPLERLAGVFSPETGARLSAMRSERQPTGRVSASVRLERAPAVGGPTTPPPPMRVGVTLEHASAMEFAALGARLGVDWPEGVVEFVSPAAGPEQIRFNHVRARLTLDGKPGGEAILNGAAAIDGAGTVSAPADLTAEFNGWRFESPLIGPLLERLTSPGTAEAYRKFNAVGPFDAKLTARTEAGERGPEPFVRVEAELSPRAMSFDWEGQRVEASAVSGRVTLRTRAGEGLHPVSGRFDALRVETRAWTADADGAWYAPVPPGRADGVIADRQVQLALTFDVAGRSMDPALRALMPGAAVEAIDALSAEFRGPFALRRGAVKTTLGDAPSPTTFMGDLDFADLAFNVGVPVDRCTGTVGIRVDARPEGASEPTTFEVRAHADALRIMGVNVTSAEATVTNGSHRGEVLIPDISAQCYSGRLTGHVTLELGADEPAAALGQTGPPAPGAPARYSAELVLAGVQLAPVLADTAAAGTTEPGPVGPPNPLTEPDSSRGEIDARLAISGVSGDLSSRRGGGAIRVSNGDIISLPMMLPLIQVSNFQIPRKDRLGYLQSDFVIRGDTATFDHISLLSDSLAIVGSGTLRWPELALNMKFNSRGNLRIPLVSGVFEALRNEFVSTTVTGTLDKPRVREEPFVGTRGVIDRLLHPGRHNAGAPPRAGSSSAAEQDRRRTERGVEATAAPTQP